MEKNWKSPKPGDVILLKDGYESIAASGRQHYGLVLSTFKKTNDPSQRFVMYSPGKTHIPGIQLKKSDLWVKKGIFGNTSDTVFQLATDVSSIKEFPSNQFLQTSASLAKDQADQASCVIQNIIDSVKSDLLEIGKQAYDGDLNNLYRSLLIEFGVSIDTIKDLKKGTPANFIA